jgi:hypothetical protein
MAKKVELELVAKVDKAVENVDKLKGEVQGLKAAQNEVKDSVDSTNKSVGNLRNGFRAAGLALKAVGIGILLKVFDQFTQILGQNQKVMDALETATTALGIAFNDLFNFIGDNVGVVTQYFKDLFENPGEKILEIGQVIQNYLLEQVQRAIEGFGLLGESIALLFEGEFSKAADTAAEGALKLGGAILKLNPATLVMANLAEAVYDNRDAIAEYTKSVIENSKAIVDNRTNLELLRIQQETLRQQYDVLAERQRQIRDDERLTFDERIAANDRLLELLKEQARLESATVEARIANLQQEQQDLGFTNERLFQILELKRELFDIEATIAGFAAEQRTNEVTLLAEKLEYEKQFTKDYGKELQKQAEDRQKAWDAEVEGERTTAKKKEDFEAQKREAQFTTAYAAVDITRSAAVLIGEETAAGAALVKTSALIQIAADTAKAISGLTANSQSNPANAVTFGAAGVAQFVSGIAIILSNIARAKQILSSGPRLPGGGGGGSLPSPSVPRPSATRPSEPSQGNTFTISGDVAERETIVTRTYVLASDVTSKQEARKQIQRESRL